MMPTLENELVSQGHTACPGCGAVQAMRYVLSVLGPRTIVALPACCWSVINGRYPESAVRVPLFHTAFETAACVASGIRAALEMRGDRDTHVLAWAGDGGTFDIGLQALSGAAERGDDILYVCYDNEAYMNTGCQRSSASPYGASTTTTPPRAFKAEEKKKIMEIIAAHRIPYAATATVSYPADLMEKVRTASKLKGTRFLHILCPCPTGWNSPPNLSVALGRAAVQSRVFPIYEIFGGTRFRITLQPDRPIPVEQYLRPQRRFAHLTADERAQVQEQVDREWARLEALVRAFPA